MESLSKQQLILLALLVSFVTALATGIFTVSLMNQMPQAVTRTIDQVVEKTVQQVAPQDAAVGSVSIDVNDQVADAVGAVSQSLVKIVGISAAGAAMPAQGLGLVVSDQGAIITDKSVLSGSQSYAAIMPDGTVVPVTVIQSQINGDVAFLAPVVGTTTLPTFVPIEINSSPRLGQTIFSLSGTSTSLVGQGIVSSLDDGEAIPTVMDSLASTTADIMTSLTGPVTAGSPLFDATGKVLGVYTSSLKADGTVTVFAPIAPLMGAIPVFR